MTSVYICAYSRTAFGRFGGSLATVRPDDLGAVPLRAIMQRYPDMDWDALDDVIFGNANQAGEDNRNVARMSALLAGLPVETPGMTLNRLCGSGMDAVVTGARAIRAGEADLIIAGGTESMSRAPFVMPKADSAFSRKAEIYDTTIGWRFVNPAMKALYGVDSMPETAENLAEECAISRLDQDRFALASQQKAAAAIAAGRFKSEIVPVSIPQRRGDPLIVDTDEHPRATSAEALAKLATPFRRDGGTVTAGNASGVNDGASALLLASEAAVAKHGLTPIARVLGGATAGVPPRIMGFGPVPAVVKLLGRLSMTLGQFDVMEFNEAFAAQALACTRALALKDDDPRINPNGGAIALGHPLGASGG
jgi:acetyl-CoA acyltransferase